MRAAAKAPETHLNRLLVLNRLLALNRLKDCVHRQRDSDGRLQVDVKFANAEHAPSTLLNRLLNRLLQLPDLDARNRENVRQEHAPSTLLNRLLNRLGDLVQRHSNPALVDPATEIHLKVATDGKVTPRMLMQCPAMLQIPGERLLRLAAGKIPEAARALASYPDCHLNGLAILAPYQHHPNQPKAPTLAEPQRSFAEEDLVAVAIPVLLDCLPAEAHLGLLQHDPPQAV